MVQATQHKMARRSSGSSGSSDETLYPAVDIVIPKADPTPVPPILKANGHAHRKPVVSPSSGRHWRNIAARKQAEREALLAPHATTRPQRAATGSALPLRNSLSVLDREITDLSATLLAQRIADRTYSSVQVLQAFIRAAILAQDATNCLTEIMFDEALQRAAELDEIHSRTGETVGPLHGVPVSIKDHIDVKGTDGASGFSAWAYRTVAERDSVIVRCLRMAGAVIYVKTSNPQSLLAIETNNNIYGRTINPHDPELSAGGSTGGEAALIAMSGSPLGVGTDIAGSIRIPALWNGIYGLKPSVGRLPHTGLQGPHAGMDTIIGCVGPMANSLADLSLFCSIVLSHQISPWDMEHQTLHMPWNPPHLPKDRKLVVAVMKDDGVVYPHPPVVRALAWAVDKLRNAGHEIVDWPPVQTQAAKELMFTMMLQDQGQEYWRHLAESDEPPTPGIDWLLASEIPATRIKRPEDVWQLVRARERIRQDAVEQMIALEDQLAARTPQGARRKIDAILCPGAATLAPRHDRSRHWMYTAIWNLLDFPGVTFPMPSTFDPATARSADQQWPPFAPRNSREKEVWDEWNPDWYKTAPIGLQLIGRRLAEEKLLEDVELVENVLQGSA